MHRCNDYTMPWRAMRMERSLPTMLSTFG
jgi:hypothetical protein